MATPAPSADAPEETMAGVIDHIVYRSEESGYTVCVLKTPGHKEGIVVVGTCAAIWAGENRKRLVDEFTKVIAGTSNLK